MATIENLSSESLVNIFKHYIRIEGHETFSRNIPRVCKKWNELSSDPSLWRDVRARNWNYLLNVSQRRLLDHTQSLTVNYYANKSYSNTKFSDVLMNIRDLKVLDLKGKELGSDAVMIVTERCPGLESLCLQSLRSGNMTWNGWDHFLTVCGPTLKELDLRYIWNNYSREAGYLLGTGIAEKCPLLERLVFFSLDHPLFPIDKVQSGCPMMKELEFRFCTLISCTSNDSPDCSFKELRKFRAFCCYFAGVTNPFKDSVNFEELKLVHNYDLELCNILEIPSDKMKVLDIRLHDLDQNLNELRDAVGRWKYTLLDLNLVHSSCDVTCVLQSLLQDNQSPRLESLSIGKNIDPCFFEEFVRKCKNLIHLNINYEHHEGHEKIEEEALEYFMKRRGN